MAGNIPSTKIVDMVGQKIGRLLVLAPYGIDRQRKATFICVCECGTFKVIPGKKLRRGRKSCGCLIGKTTKHGHTVGGRWSSEYGSWAAMMKRCYDPKNDNYKYYGERGIRVNIRYHDFRNFLADLGKKPTPQYTLDRISQTGHYEPGNLHWATMKDQARNTSRNRLLTYNGETKPLVEWAEKMGLKQGTLRARIFDYGWSIDLALTIPLGIKRPI